MISSYSPEAMAEFWNPLLADMQAKLGIPVAPRFFEDYAAVIWAMSENKVHVAWMGNKAAIEAVDRAGAEVALQIVSITGETGYHSLLLAPSSSKLASERELLSHPGDFSFGDGDPNSTSGHVVPGYYLFSRNCLDPKKIFKRVSVGSHEENFLAVAEGKLDAATGNDIDLKRLRSRYPQQADKVKVIWRSPLIPSSPIVWRVGLDESLKLKLRDFFLAYGKPAPGKSNSQVLREKAVLTKLSWAGFAISSDRQLAAVRVIELGGRLARLRESQAVPEAEKTRKLAELTQQLSVLEAECAEASQ